MRASQVCKLKNRLHWCIARVRWHETPLMHSVLLCSMVPLMLQCFPRLEATFLSQNLSQNVPWKSLSENKYKSDCIGNLLVTGHFEHKFPQEHVFCFGFVDSSESREAVFQQSVTFPGTLFGYDGDVVKLAEGQVMVDKNLFLPLGQIPHKAVI